MMKAVSRAFALVALTVATVASAQDYQDTTPYVVDSAKYPYTIYPSSTDLNNTVPWETQVLPFNPSATYTQVEQDTVVDSEATLLSADKLFDINTGKPVLDFVQATIPEANTPNVPPPSETPPTQTGAGKNLIGQMAATPVSVSYQRTELYGNSLFGAGYNVNTSVTATPANGSVAKKEEAVAEGRVYGTVFNIQKDLVRGRASVCGQQGGCNSGTAALYALGSQIWSANLAGSFAPTPINWSRTFFSVSKTFVVGPVPVTVKALLSGGVKMTVTGQVNPALASITAATGAWANVVASAAVNVIIASFGVSGSLALVNATAQAAASLGWSLCTPTWSLKANLSLTALSGTLKAFVKIGVLFFSKTWNVTIASWSGISKSLTLLNASGAISSLGC
ncbi:hypothetical protein [Hyalangium versicolor]|uniref:hypothetical protein n=1 Tax=Hyalangium versicolor TaxID=2861190 RepID=UPI001CCD3857|nr:hypothetical protein [Hyalangium versicolor]